MKFPTQDTFHPIPSGQKPPYDTDNPLLRIIRQLEKVPFAAEREHYYADQTQYLLPYRDLGLYGPSGSDWQQADVTQQDNKNDFQKQNIARFKLGDFFLLRGYASAGGWGGSFLKICYRSTPGTTLGLATQGDPGQNLRLYIKVGRFAAPELLILPLNPESGFFETELWAYSGGNLRNLLSAKGQNSFDAGFIQARPDIVRGSIEDFEGSAVDALRDGLNRRLEPWNIYDHAPDHTLHPVRTLHVELAFANEDGTIWDSKNGANYHVEFDMLMRGWRNSLACGLSTNPHGGVGTLEYRNLVSNYFDYEKRRRDVLGESWKNELGRDLIAGNFDAQTWNFGEPGGPRVTESKRERFMAVDYMDLHILQPECGIGIHRHRDNQEAFFMLSGKGLMLVGDWAEFPHRERAFEMRTLKAGDIAICKTGQLHALYNVMDEECTLFMFGGYD
jgi:mannose-6-phosphate isomerase-like protein (cupin superfamily)